MNIGGGNPKRSNLKHSKASLKKLYKSRLTYKKSWEEQYFLYVLISIGENHRGGETLLGGGGNPRVPPPPLYQTLIYIYIYIIYMFAIIKSEDSYKYALFTVKNGVFSCTKKNV